MDAEHVEPVDPDVERIVQDFHDIQASREDGNKVKDVIIVGTIGHLDHGGHMAASLMRILAESHPDINVREATPEMLDELRARDVLGIGMPALKLRALDDFDVYGRIDRKSKGEKKRERAFNRRFYGRGNSF